MNGYLIKLALGGYRAPRNEPLYLTREGAQKALDRLDEVGELIRVRLVEENND
jgi:hypothetical protein